jgi:hypothetical protein
VLDIYSEAEERARGKPGKHKLGLRAVKGKGIDIR